jgi:catechol 2,3-dioxygenase-like lactoylglutathione lyase family enzyme
MRRQSHLPLIIALAAAATVAAAAGFRATMSRGEIPRAEAPAGFAARIAALSEAGGHFDTDNLISNEESYLQVLPDLQRAGLRGGAYIGVGPDQNFTYMARIQPTIAFIVDIRRDNMLLHLLFKALFESARTRVEYLSLLFGRPPPAALDEWRAAPIQRLVPQLDRAAVDAPSVDALRARIDGVVRRFGVALSRDDVATIDRFHRRFITEGLSLRFHSAGRPPQGYYPDYRQLLLAIDPLGGHGHYLASEDAFQFVKSLHAAHLVIPVVGNLNGPTALAAIGRLLTDRGERLSAFYTSNVEFYLFRDGTFPRFAANVARIPHAERALIIRSVFGSGGFAGGGSTSHVQPVAEFLAKVGGGKVSSYRDLVTRR